MANKWGHHRHFSSILVAPWSKKQDKDNVGYVLYQISISIYVADVSLNFIHRIDVQDACTVLRIAVRLVQMKVHKTNFVEVEVLYDNIL